MSFIILSANGHQDRNSFTQVVRDAVQFVSRHLAPTSGDTSRIVATGDANRIAATGDWAGRATRRHDVEVDSALRRFGLQPYDAS